MTATHPDIHNDGEGDFVTDEDEIGSAAAQDWSHRARHWSDLASADRHIAMTAAETSQMAAYRSQTAANRAETHGDIARAAADRASARLTVVVFFLLGAILGALVAIIFILTIIRILDAGQPPGGPIETTISASASPVPNPERPSRPATLQA